MLKRKNLVSNALAIVLSATLSILITNIGAHAQPTTNCSSFAPGPGKTQCWVRLVYKPGTSLTAAYLVGADLSGSTVLRGRQMTRANLSRANLKNAKMAGAQLSRADLSNADLSGAELIGADLTGANLSGTRLTGAVVAVATRGSYQITKGINFADWKRRGAVLVNETLPAQPGPPASGTSQNVRSMKNWAGIEFVWISPGSFIMGSPSSEEWSVNIERPQHQVNIAYGFWMGKFEVTQQEFRSVVGALPAFLRGYCAKCPAVTASYFEAQEFIRRLNSKNDGFLYRLPSESEWEYAARAGTVTPFAFGASLSSRQANFDGQGPYGGAPKSVFLGGLKNVGSYASNAWGLYDMHGNASEWTDDFYTESYNGYPTDGSPNKALGDPESRVARGGSWAVDGAAVRSAWRAHRLAKISGNRTGIRVVAQRATSITPPLNPVLAVPKLIGPAHNQILVNLPRRTVLRWQAVAGATAYRVEVERFDRVSNRWVSIHNQSAARSTQFEFTYPDDSLGRWRVWAIGRNNGVGLKSQWRSFSFKTASLSAPRQVYPTNGQVITVKGLNVSNGPVNFIWNPVSGATRYYLEVEKASGSGWVVHRKLYVNAGSHRMEFPNGTIGRWRVQSVGPTGGLGAKSDWRRFSLKYKPF